MKSFFAAAAFAATFAVGLGAHAQEAAVPDSIVLCSGCHGEQGISLADEIPNLAGQKKPYLTKALKDYRANRRNNPTMNAMAANLSDEDIENLANYFSGLKRP